MKLTKHLERMLPQKWEQVLEDPRRCERKWDFTVLLKVVVNALASGCKTLREIETLTETSGIRLPDTTLHDLLVQVDPEPLNKELAKGVKQASRNHELDKKELPFRLTVIDGKNLSRTAYAINEFSIHRSQKGCEVYAHHALRAFLVSSELKLLMGQMMMPNGVNENGLFRSFIEQLAKLFKNTKLLEVLSMDAAFLGAKNAAAVVEHGLQYVFALKSPENHPITAEAIRILGHKRRPQRIEEENINGMHIKRALYRAKAPSVKGWLHATEIWRIHKEITSRKGEVTTEEHYYVTNLASSQLHDALILKTVRMHWEIENNANWVMDTAWQEDTRPWCNRALELITILRAMIYNAVARLKLRRLRSASTRAWTWKEILQVIQHCLFPVQEPYFATL